MLSGALKRATVLELYMQGIASGEVSPEFARLTGDERYRAALAFFDIHVEKKLAPAPKSSGVFTSVDQPTAEGLSTLDMIVKELEQPRRVRRLAHAACTSAAVRISYLRKNPDVVFKNHTASARFLLSYLPAKDAPMIDLIAGARHWIKTEPLSEREIYRALLPFFGQDEDAADVADILDGHRFGKCKQLGLPLYSTRDMPPIDCIAALG